MFDQSDLHSVEAKCLDGRIFILAASIVDASDEGMV